jgi:hypothetical protein
MPSLHRGIPGLKPAWNFRLKAATCPRKSQGGWGTESPHQSQPKPSPRARTQPSITLITTPSICAPTLTQVRSDSEKKCRTPFPLTDSLPGAQAPRTGAGSNTPHPNIDPSVEFRPRGTNPAPSPHWCAVGLRKYLRDNTIVVTQKLWHAVRFLDRIFRRAARVVPAWNWGTRITGPSLTIDL